eukprot:scaffold325_cov230-Pinguiococcus_pyrenoidosus.AAC.5
MGGRVAARSVIYFPLPYWNECFLQRLPSRHQYSGFVSESYAATTLCRNIEFSAGKARNESIRVCHPRNSLLAPSLKESFPCAPQAYSKSIATPPIASKSKKHTHTHRHDQACH